MHVSTMYTPFHLVSTKLSMRISNTKVSSRLLILHTHEPKIVTIAKQFTYH